MTAYFCIMSIFLALLITCCTAMMQVGRKA